MFFDLFQFVVGVLRCRFQKLEEFFFGGGIIKNTIFEMGFGVGFGVVVELLFELGDGFLFVVDLGEELLDFVDFLKFLFEHLKDGGKYGIWI